MCITTAKPYDSIYIPLKLDKNDDATIKVRDEALFTFLLS